MSVLGMCRGKEVHDYTSGAAADEASQLFDIFAVYWTSGRDGVMLWRGEDVAYVKMHSNGNVIIEDFNEDVFKPKRKETPEIKETQEKRPAKETGKNSVATGELYDKNWYEKIMKELKDQWDIMRPAAFKDEW